MCQSWLSALVLGFAIMPVVLALNSGHPMSMSSGMSSTILTSETSSPASTSTPSAPNDPLSSPPLTPALIPTASTSAESETHTIKVGQSGFKFEPAELKEAHVGDKVYFEFFPRDHSVAQAEFGLACMPYERSGQDRVGFWSDTQNLNDTDQVRRRYIRVLCGVGGLKSIFEMAWLRRERVGLGDSC